MKKSIYVLGTGLSHDGSTCLLKDGKVCVAIEKERLTRIKHDGGNDTMTIDYCLKGAGISMIDVDLIVQNANFGSFEFGNDYFKGHRSFNELKDIPIVTISHHLAHAYSTFGTCPFDDFNALIMDGCGNAYDDCIDLMGAEVFDLKNINPLPHLYHEKDSYYSFTNNTYSTLIKDFSEWGYGFKNYPMHPNTSKHSIGGIYSAVSVYCFGSIDDPGKLMGLSPYGRPGKFNEDVFELKDGRVFLNYGWMGKYRKPARSYDDFKKNFQYYADIAYGIQREVEEAILYIVQSRLNTHPTEKMCYSGGTALNAVANARVRRETDIKQLYIEPAAGDNGLSLGCAFYGWLEVLKKEKVRHNGSTCFGISYSSQQIREDINQFSLSIDPYYRKGITDAFFKYIHDGKRLDPGPNAIIDFHIEDVGTYQVSINHSIQCNTKQLFEPSCHIYSSSADFYKALYKPQIINELIQSGNIKVSNYNELDLLLMNISIEGFIKKVEQKNELVNHEKEGPLQIRYCEDFIYRAACLLADGKIIGWFQDECEFGPRALGRRSILADPRNAAVRQFINSEIKFREDFRPFAPSVLREDVSQYFETNDESPYMILVDLMKETYREKLKSVVHKNNTSRVQTVTQQWNQTYYQLLQEFKKLTGLPVLLNTSFNRKGMPIVETPREAIDFFFSCKLDYLVVGKYIIGKTPSANYKQEP